MRKMQFISFTLMLLLTVSLSACSAEPSAAVICGDGICSDGEDASNCATDCDTDLVVLPSSTPQPTPTEVIEPVGYVTFAVYVSDFVNHEKSAQTVLALIDLFTANGMRGEFYLSGPMAQLYSQEYGEVIDRLGATDMAISYHVQPPHPQIPGFQGPVTGLPVDQTLAMITRYETERLDLETGGLIVGEPGGYRYLEQLFGKPPVAVETPRTPGSGFALPIFTRLGAQVVVLPGVANPQQPFISQYEMLVRPEDITIDRWQVEGVDGARGWWEMQSNEFSSAFDPLDRLQILTEAWDSERLPFVLVPIDEFSFYRAGPAPWTLIYYQDGERSGPKAPPFDLNAPDSSAARSESDKQAVWEAYADMVEWAGVYLEPVTSKEILQLAANPK